MASPSAGHRGSSAPYEQECVVCPEDLFVEVDEKEIFGTKSHAIIVMAIRLCPENFIITSINR